MKAANKIQKTFIKQQEENHDEVYHINEDHFFYSLSLNKTRCIARFVYGLYDASYINILQALNHIKFALKASMPVNIAYIGDIIKCGECVDELELLHEILQDSHFLDQDPITVLMALRDEKLYHFADGFYDYLLNNSLSMDWFARFYLGSDKQAATAAMERMLVFGKVEGWEREYQEAKDMFIKLKLESDVIDITKL
jgi:hypothetical protein